MADKTVKQLTTEFTSLTADDYFIAQRDTDNVTGKVKNSAVFNGGWSPVESPPDTVVANGNRSYTLTFNSLDLTDTISPGMRVRTTRTVAAPDQCTDLEASSSQYYNKTSPSGMTFTDDFVVSAWIKLESYPAAGGNYSIASRYNGTSGWELRVKTGSGQIEMYGWNGGAGNYSGAVSYQSVPLNKWVHVTAQLDMSTFTATTTTTYMMIDGVDIPCVVTRGGTNPTALIQAGNLEIGSTNSGTSPFDGKIAQVAIYSAKVTQATILASMNQGLTGSETSLVSAYSFDNSINDLSATANNLTAQNSAVATNTDSPFGNGATSSTLDYGLVQSVSFSTNTTMVVQVPSGCTIPTTGGVSALAYSVQANPYGWANDTLRWEVLLKQMTSTTVTFGAVDQWFVSPIKLTLPIGNWQRLGYEGSFMLSSTVAGTRHGHFTLASSAPTNAVRNQNLTSTIYFNTSATIALSTLNKFMPYTNTTQESHYIYADIASASGTEAYHLSGDLGAVLISALPAGL
jgi:hypothetical protein